MSNYHVQIAICGNHVPKLVIFTNHFRIKCDYGNREQQTRLVELGVRRLPNTRSANHSELFAYGGLESTDLMCSLLRWHI